MREAKAHKAHKRQVMLPAILHARDNIFRVSECGIRPLMKFSLFAHVRVRLRVCLLSLRPVHLLWADVVEREILLVVYKNIAANLPEADARGKNSLKV